MRKHFKKIRKLLKKRSMKIGGIMGTGVISIGWAYLENIESFNIRELFSGDLGVALWLIMILAIIGGCGLGINWLAKK